jgi:hypothetical protein
MGLTLSAGTYYLIEAAYSGADKGSFTLRARTGTLSPVYTVTPSATPQAAVEPNDTSVQAEDLGGGSSLGTGQVIRTGSADDGADANDYFSFVPLNGGTATAFIDGFDDGTEARDMDLYVYNGGLTQIASSVTSNPVDAVSFAVTAGQTYYLRVNAYFGSGPYRLTLKTP